MHNINVAQEYLPDEVKFLQHAGHLLTFVLQVLSAELGLGGVGDSTAFLPQELQRVIHQLQHAQEVQLAGFVHIPRAQLENMQTQIKSAGQCDDDDDDDNDA